MGNTKKAPRPRRARPETEMAFMPGATVDEDHAVNEMMRQTHDGLIELLGPRRRSGIRWRHFHGRAAAETFLDEMYGQTGSVQPTEGGCTAAEAEAALAQFRAFLAEHGDRAVLVVAWCDAVRPAARAAGGQW